MAAVIERPTVLIEDPVHGVRYYVWRRARPQRRQARRLLVALAIVLAAAFSALLSTASSRSWVIEGSAVHAGLMAGARDSGAVRDIGPGLDAAAAEIDAPGAAHTTSPVDPVSAYSHADDPTPAASEAASAPRPSSREDPPARVVLGQEQPEVEAILRAAAREFGVSADDLVAIAMCESSLRAVPRVGRAQEVGWFQWLPRTWEANAKRLGYTILDITDPVAQARLTAFVLREDGGWRWSCAR